MSPWFLYFLEKAIAQRKGRFLLSSASVMLTVTVVTALVTVSTGIREKIAGQLRQYGANMIVTDASGKDIPPGVVNSVTSRSPHIHGAAAQVYGSVMLRNAMVEIVGIERGSATGYRVHGTVPQEAGDVMAGANLAHAFGIVQGDRIRLGSEGRGYRVTALFEKGTDEDSALVMPLASAQALLGTTGVSAVLLNGDLRHLDAIDSAVRAVSPALRVTALRQVAVAQERLLGKVQLLMLLVTAVVLFSSIIALGSTMGANVIERMEEIGLMKSMGAAERDIRAFFLSEAALAGLAGAAAGYIAGLAAAEAVSRTAFGSFISPGIAAAPLAFALGIVVAVLSTYLPVRDAMKVVPAVILRGE
jgi:putative ABC transport system permease protein